MMKRNEASHIQNLDRKEAIKKMKQLVGHTKTCLFVTRLSDTPLQARPMETQEVDDEGNFWFFSNEESDKNMEIESDSRVQLFFSSQSNSEFMSIYGHAMISRDQKRIDELWHPMAKAWLKEGKDDPSLTMLMVIPDEAYYWDTKNNKIVSLLKVMTSSVSGKVIDDEIEGRLNV
jgi:general stress protein 26